MNQNKVETKGVLNFKTLVMQAFEGGDLEQAFSALQGLDKHMTGATHGTFAIPPDATVNQVKQEISETIKKIKNNEEGRLIVYLAGGWSRIYVDYDKGKVTLKIRDHDAPDEIMKKWNALT